MSQKKNTLEYSWTQLDDEELLKVRICDLKLQLTGSEIEKCVERLYSELDERGLQRFRPKCYLGDEWFSPDGVNAIAIPFYLAHPRLKALEKSVMFEVEGGEEEECMKLLRHEAGHCFDHAYRVSRKQRWRSLFGKRTKDYDPDTYRPRPYSKSFVRHLKDWYAQAHPDEDFAETFAVWLDPKSQWEKMYLNWQGATAKLRYVDDLAKSCKEKQVPSVRGPLPWSVSRMKSTLERYYKRRKKEAADDYPDFFDEDLRKIFDGDQNLSARENSALQFMRRNRKQIIDSVSFWTREKKYTINALVKRLILRCKENDLRVGKQEDQTKLEVAAYLATIVTHYLFTGKFKRNV